MFLRSIFQRSIFLHSIFQRDAPLDLERGVRVPKRQQRSPQTPLPPEIQTLVQALAQEQEKSEQLLLNILPASIVHQLKHEPRPIAHGYQNVTVMFADIVGFTPLSARLSPRRLVCLLNLIFSAFDQLTELHQLEKIKTIGDAYMVAGGLPDTCENHAEAMVELALGMQEAIAYISQLTGEALSLRIGLHTGPVVAGVIGIKKFSYDLWGDTVNLASRMESQGINGSIQISASTYEQLPQGYGTRALGGIQVKGQDNIKAYEVVSKRVSEPVQCANSSGSTPSSRSFAASRAARARSASVCDRST
jgi:adenylate cyclase